MISIVQHTIPLSPSFAVSMPEGSKVIAVLKIGVNIELIAIENDANTPINYNFLLYETGDPIAVTKDQYIQSFESGATVYHLFKDPS